MPARVNIHTTGTTQLPAHETAAQRRRADILRLLAFPPPRPPKPGPHAGRKTHLTYTQDLRW